MYFTEIKNNHYARIYKYEYKYYIDEEAWVWENEIAIDLIDDEDRILFSFPLLKSRNELFSVVTSQVSGVNDLMQEFLEEGDE